jgi:ureidoacrylate peracid hydrolase
VSDCIGDRDANWQETSARLSAQNLCVLHNAGEVIDWLQAQTAPRILDFAHMLLEVSDIELSRRFYTDLLGFTPRKAAPLADGRPFVPFRQGLALTSGGAKNARQIDHMAFRVTDVRTIAKRLAGANVRFFNELHDGIYGLTIYVADPDGTKVELFQEGAKLG